MPEKSRVSNVAPSARRVDVELRALEAGIKPALRLSAEPGEMDAMAARYKARGHQVVRAEIRPYGRRREIAYVASTRDVLDELAHLEARLTRPRLTSREPIECTRAIGERLGYPSCCVEAFIRRIAPRPWAGARTQLLRRMNAITYLGVRDAWVPRGNPRLNSHLLAEGRSLISFEPCRYDCPAAGAVADRIADVVGREDPGWLAFVEGELARPIAVDRRGARAHVDLEPTRRVRAASAPTGPLRATREQDIALAARLAGRVVDVNGRVRVRDWIGRPIVVEFGSP